MLEIIALTDKGPKICTQVFLIGAEGALIFTGTFRATEDCHILGATITREKFKKEILNTDGPMNVIKAGELGAVNWRLEV